MVIMMLTVVICISASGRWKSFGPHINSMLLFPYSQPLSDIYTSESGSHFIHLINLSLLLLFLTYVVSLFPMGTFPD